MGLFLKMNCLSVLMNLLKVQERVSRTKKNFGIQLEILRIFELVVRNQEGQRALMHIPDSMTFILFNFTPFHSEMNCLILTIMVEILTCDSSDDTYDSYIIMEAINKYKQEKYMDHRMQIFMDVLQHNKNLVLLENTIIFI